MASGHSKQPKPPVEVDANLLWSEARETRSIAEAEGWSEPEWGTYSKLCLDLRWWGVDHVVVVRREQDDLIGLQAAGYHGVQPEEEHTALEKLARLRNEVRIDTAARRGS